MENEPIGRWLDELASASPAPGGGAAAALELALAAALVEMVCNLTIGRPAHAEHESTMRSALARAGVLRLAAVALVAEDAAAFRAVIDAYKLPKESESQVSVRGKQIQLALAGAADVPRRTALAATEVLGLAAEILPGANPNVISDIAASACAARAALGTALVNVEINRAALTDPELQASLAATLEEIEQALTAADRVIAQARSRMAA